MAGFRRSPAIHVQRGERTAEERAGRALSGNPCERLARVVSCTPLTPQEIGLDRVCGSGEDPLCAAPELEGGRDELFGVVEPSFVQRQHRGGRCGKPALRGLSQFVRERGHRVDALAHEVEVVGLRIDEHLGAERLALSFLVSSQPCDLA